MKNPLIRSLHVKFLLYFNRVLGKYGQNTYCRKSEVKLLISEVGLKWKDNPIARNRFQELLDDVEKLKISH